jgi:hypothetical protein
VPADGIVIEQQPVGPVTHEPTPEIVNVIFDTLPPPGQAVAHRFVIHPVPPQQHGAPMPPNENALTCAISYHNRRLLANKHHIYAERYNTSRLVCPPSSS